MKLKINGKEVAIQPSQITVSALLQNQGFNSPRGLAVSVNATVVPRRQWSEVFIQSDDDVLIITATQGG